MSKIKMQKF